MLLFRFSCSLLAWKFFELPSNRVLSSNYWVAASTNLRSMPMMVHRFICRTAHACLPLCLPNTNLVDTLVELGGASPAQPSPSQLQAASGAVLLLAFAPCFAAFLHISQGLPHFAVCSSCGAVSKSRFFSSLNSRNLSPKLKKSKTLLRVAIWMKMDEVK